MTVPRIAVVTNGNYFANLALSRLFDATYGDVDYRVVVTTGLRSNRGNRIVEAVALFRRWGVRYSVYKVGTYALPVAVQAIRRQPMTVQGRCRDLGIPVLRARTVNTGSGESWLREYRPDILLSFSCPYRIRNNVLDIPSFGSLNVHSSLLPEYAGVCTYVHVLADGRRETGVTVHEMVERFDAGRIVAAARVPIGGPTSVFALFSALCRAAGEVLVIAIDQTLADGKISGQPQDDTRRTYYGEPTRAEVAALRSRGHRLIRASDVASMLRGGS